MNKIMDIAAAYSESPRRTYLWNKGFQDSAVDKNMASSIVPTAPIMAYKNAAKERFAWARSSSWIALWKYIMLFRRENISVEKVVT